MLSTTFFLNASSLCSSFVAQLSFDSVGTMFCRDCAKLHQLSTAARSDHLMGGLAAMVINAGTSRPSLPE